MLFLIVPSPFGPIPLFGTGTARPLYYLLSHRCKLGLIWQTPGCECHFSLNASSQHPPRPMLFSSSSALHYSINVFCILFVHLTPTLKHRGNLSHFTRNGSIPLFQELCQTWTVHPIYFTKINIIQETTSVNSLFRTLKATAWPEVVARTPCLPAQLLYIYTSYPFPLFLIVIF